MRQNQQRCLNIVIGLSKANIFKIDATEPIFGSNTIQHLCIILPPLSISSDQISLLSHFGQQKFSFPALPHPSHVGVHSIFFIPSITFQLNACLELCFIDCFVIAPKPRVLPHAANTFYIYIHFICI